MFGLLTFLCVLAILGMVSYLVYKQNQSDSGNNDTVTRMMGTATQPCSPGTCTGGDCYACIDWGAGDYSCESSQYSTMTKDECEACRKSGGCSRH